METIADLSESNFNVNNITFSTPKPSGSGGKSVGIYNMKGIFRVAIPELIQWGAADFKGPDGKGNDKFEFTIQFPTPDYKTEQATTCLTNLQLIENKFLEAGQANSKAWFGKVYPLEVLRALWSPMLKYPKNKSTGEPDLDGAPGLRVKLPRWEGVWKSEVYNDDSELLFPDPSNPALSPVDLLLKGVKATCLLQCGGLWFANGKFGVTWKLIQAVVPKPKPSLMGTCFLKKKTPSAAAATTEEPVSNVVACTMVDDSDEEDGDEGEEPAVVAAVEQQATESTDPQQQEQPVASTTDVSADGKKKKVVIKKK
jgi:hypothetical protein